MIKKDQTLRICLKKKTTKKPNKQTKKQQTKKTQNMYTCMGAI